MNEKRHYYDDEGFYIVKWVNGVKMLYNYPAKNATPYIHPFYELMELGTYSSKIVDGI
jgi:hypothetical protein